MSKRDTAINAEILNECMSKGDIAINARTVIARMVELDTAINARTAINAQRLTLHSCITDTQDSRTYIKLHAGTPKTSVSTGVLAESVNDDVMIECDDEMIPAHLGCV